MTTTFSSHYLTTTGVGFYRFNFGAEILDRGLMSVQNAGIIGDRITGLMNCHSKAYDKVAKPVGKARNVISATRFVVSLEKLVTGKMFWIIDSKTGDFFYHKKDIVKGRSSLVKCKGTDPAAERIIRDWIDIASDIILMIARLLSPINLLHNLKAINLGVHAQWTGILMITAFAVTTTIGIVQAIRDLIEDSSEIVRRIVELLSSFFDFLAIPWESGFGYDHPILAITGAAICILSGVFYIAKEAIYSDYEING